MASRRTSHPQPLARRTLALALAAVAVAGALALLAATPRAQEPPPAPANPHGRFQGDCSECHSADAWRPARISRRFDHRKRSGFALTGAHLAAGCRACHASLDFTQVQRECVACHLDPHVGEFGPDCARCHTTRTFIDRAGFVRMHQLTRLPLVGGHAALDCQACHPPVSQGHARYATASSGCRDCHAPGTQPDHRGFSSDCATCHTMMAWRPSRFDHSRTGFPLTCPHRAPIACVACHGTPWTNAVPRDCVACHRAAYDATTTPAHAAAGFPTACASCHKVSVCGWTGASFDHDGFFPIASGRHGGIACATCHTVSSDYGQFSCLSGGCHPQADTDGRHGGVRNYRYDSQACYGCHPRGAGGG